MEEFIQLIENAISIKKEQITITPEMELVRDIGMTSLDMMVIVLEIERRYQKKLPFEKLAAAKTVMDLYRLAVQ